VPIDLDLEFRLAVFDHLRRMQDAHGRVIPFSVLNQGIQFRGERVPLWNYQRGIFRRPSCGRVAPR